MKNLPKNLIKEWNDKNLSYLNLSACSHKKVSWKCIKGHLWQASIKSRYYGSGCPYCSRKIVSTEYSLAATNPVLSLDWHFDKNGSLTPKDVLENSHKSVWWKCIKSDILPRFQSWEYVRECTFLNFLFPEYFLRIWFEIEDGSPKCLTSLEERE